MMEKDLCCNCFDYNELHIKPKLQQAMGHRSQCRWPEVGAAVPIVELQDTRSIAIGAGSSLKRQ